MEQTQEEDTTTETNRLMKLRQQKQQTIYEHENSIKNLEKEIGEIYQRLSDVCEHIWAFEPPVMYERGYYYCSTCGCNQ